nr:reverse transcriptase domain-containing protein [Tanacetum cinerariifolium]
MMVGLFQMNTTSTSGSGSLLSNTVANPKGELKAITTRSGIVLDGPTVPTHPPFINPEEDERVEETLMDPDLSEYTIKVPPPPVQKYKPLSQREYVVHQRNPLHPNIPYPSRMLKQKQQEKDEVQIHKFWQMFKQLHINITLTDALILMPKYQKMLKALLSNKKKLQELANTPLNENCSAPSGNPTFSSHPEITLPEVNDDIFDSDGGNVLPEKLLDFDSTKDLHPSLHVNPVSGSTTYSSSLLLEELADELALITFPPKYDDDLQFDVESDLKEIEFLLHQDIDSSLKDSIDQSNFANLADSFVDSMPEMFTDEHALDYSSPLIFDEYDDDFFEVESDAKNVYDDPFDSKGEKLKESKLLIDELDLPCDFLPSEYDSFTSQDFSRVDVLPSTNNEDKVFNPGILSQENPFEIIARVVQDNKLAISNASLVLENFDPPFYELSFFKEVSRSKMLLLFSSENEEKVFKLGIHTSENVHSSRLRVLVYAGVEWGR